MHTERMSTLLTSTQDELVSALAVIVGLSLPPMFPLDHNSLPFAQDCFCMYRVADVLVLHILESLSRLAYFRTNRELKI